MPVISSMEIVPALLFGTLNRTQVDLTNVFDFIELRVGDLTSIATGGFKSASLSNLPTWRGDACHNVPV